MTIYWPQNLPQEQFLGLTVERSDSRVQTPMELGAPKIRRRSILEMATTSPETVFTGPQVALFETFWTTTLSGGVSRFVWRHPVTDASVEMSFRSRPSFSPLAGHQDPNQRQWRAALPLRIHT
jgi:hypothetical protein